MDKKRITKIIAITVGGIIIVGGIVIGGMGYWPIALVDRTSITYDMFRENVMMADHFYRSNLKIAGKDDSVIMTGDAQRDLQRVTMEGLVEEVLIDHALADRYTPGDLQQLINNKLNDIDLTSSDMGKGTQLLYGLTPDRFKELVLIPQAKQEILEGNLTLRNENFNDWMATKKSEAHVSIFIPIFSWNNNAVTIK